MPGEPDLAYISARRTLLDALEALHKQLGALVLVGAQAVYLRTGESDLAVAPYTTDADIAVDPTGLADVPDLGESMVRAGFSLHPTNVGIWIGSAHNVHVDLLVPAALGGPGRRAARLGVHGKRVALKVNGLEAAVVDRSPMFISALDASDRRIFEVAVAGPAALLVAKLHKLGERQDQPRRHDDKDAFDVYRILFRFDARDLVPRFHELLAHPLAGEVTRQALDHLSALFGTVESLGSSMAGRNVEGIGDPALISASAAALAADLIDAIGGMAEYSERGSGGRGWR